MKKLIAVLMLCLSAQTFALEVADVKLDDTAQLGSTTLQLNGAGIRTWFIFRVYVGALYLGEKTHSAAAVLDATGAKRVTMVMLRSVGNEKFLKAFDEGLTANNTPAELAALDARLKEFSAVFRKVNEAKKGDVITLDYFPGEGTRVGFNGVEIGRVAGAEFNRALLKVWLGDHPVDDDLKQGLLGE